MMMGNQSNEHGILENIGTTHKYYILGMYAIQAKTRIQWPVYLSEPTGSSTEDRNVQ